MRETGPQRHTSSYNLIFEMCIASWRLIVRAGDVIAVLMRHNAKNGICRNVRNRCKEQNWPNGRNHFSEEHRHTAGIRSIALQPRRPCLRQPMLWHAHRKAPPAGRQFHHTRRFTEQMYMQQMMVGAHVKQASKCCMAADNVRQQLVVDK